MRAFALAQPLPFPIRSAGPISSVTRQKKWGKEDRGPQAPGGLPPAKTCWRMHSDPSAYGSSWQGRDSGAFARRGRAFHRAFGWLLKDHRWYSQWRSRERPRGSRTGTQWPTGLRAPPSHGPCARRGSYRLPLVGSAVLALDPRLWAASGLVPHAGAPRTAARYWVCAGGESEGPMASPIAGAPSTHWRAARTMRPKRWRTAIARLGAGNLYGEM